MLSCTKYDAFTFLFYFLRLSCSHSSHSLRHPSLEINSTSRTLRQRSQFFLSGRCPFAPRHTIFTSSASSLFGNQQQLTHPPVKSSNFPLLKNHVSQGLLFVNILTLPCLGSLWFATHPYYSLNPYINLYYVVYFYIERPPPSIIFYSHRLVINEQEFSDFILCMS